MTLGKNGNVYYSLQFPREVLNEALRFMLLPTFSTQIFGFSMGNLDRFSPSLYFPLISPLETENIPSIWLDQDVNFYFCIYYNLFLPI